MLPQPWFAFSFCPFSLVILFILQAHFGFFLELRPCWCCLLFPGSWDSLAVVVLSENACGSGALYLFGAGSRAAAGLSVIIGVSYTVPSFIFYFRNMWSSLIGTLIFPENTLVLVLQWTCFFDMFVFCSGGKGLLLFVLILFCLPSLVHVLLSDAWFFFLSKKLFSSSCSMVGFCLSSCAMTPDPRYCYELKKERQQKPLTRFGIYI